METDGGEAGKRSRAADAAAAGSGATAGRAAATRQEGRDNLQFEDAFEGAHRDGWIDVDVCGLYTQWLLVCLEAYLIQSNTCP